jgi:hypothetical protein
VSRQVYRHRREQDPSQPQGPSQGREEGPRAVTIHPVMRSSLMRQTTNIALLILVLLAGPCSRLGRIPQPAKPGPAAALQPLRDPREVPSRQYPPAHLRG